MNFIESESQNAKVKKEKLKTLFPNVDKPTIIRGFFKDTFACQNWNENTIGKVFGNNKFNIDSYTKDVGHWTNNGIKKNLQEYVDYMKKHDKPNLYLAEFTIEGGAGEKPNISDDILDMISDHLHTRNYYDFDTFDKIVMYFGKNASTECHIHFVDNYIVNQVFGSKTFYCFDYNDNDHIINKNSISNIIINNLPAGNGYATSYNDINTGKQTRTFLDLDFNTFNKLYKVTSQERLFRVKCNKK